MCGIVGYIGNIQTKHEAAFKDLLIFDQVRGEDSTGIAGLSFVNTSEYWKSLELPWEFLQHSRANRILNKRNKVMIGHNRAATKGKITARNAHPFLCGDILGVHNGTLANKWELSDHTDFDVDSEALFHNIDKFGVEEVIPNVRGAYALVWLDHKEKTFNILRNKERPLWCAVQKDGKAMWYASEPWMLNAALSRRGIEIGEKGMQQFMEDMWYRWDYENLDKKLEVPTTKRVVGKPPHVYQARPSSSKGGRGRGGKGNINNPSRNTSVRSNGNSKHDTPKVERTCSAHGKQWTVGQKITFVINNIEDSNSSAKVQGSVVGCPEQKIICYVPTSNTLYDSLDDMITEFSADIVSMQWGSYNDKEHSSELMIWLNARTLECGPKGSNVSKINKYDLTGPDGQTLTVAQWNKFIERGCCFCGDVALPLSQAGDILWLDSHQPGDYVCPSCLEQEATQEYLREAGEIPNEGDKVQ